VIIVVRGAELSASKLVTTKVLGHPRIEVRPNTAVKEFRGDTKLRSVVLHDTATGADEEVFPGVVFVFVGLEPNTWFLRGVVDVDAAGFVRTSPTLETSLPGVFAAGDARLGSTKQLVSAAGEGATAALMVRQYLHAARAASAAIPSAAGE
jgi:thioredoxin reductase (NADPH)